MKLWDLRHLALAKEIASWSKDPSTQVGALIVGANRRPLSWGYNGFASGVPDCPSAYLDRKLKYEKVIHAEVNAIILSGRDLRDSTLYTYPFPPCGRCSGVVINAGISRVVSLAPWPERWDESIQLGLDQFAAAGVETQNYRPEDLKWLALENMRVQTSSSCC